MRAWLAHFSAAANPEDAAIAAELREFEEVLRWLQQAGRPWHLAVDS